MVYIHAAFFHLPLRERKKPPRLPLSETGAVHYALFVLSQALTQLLAGILDRSLGGCQNYRALGFAVVRCFRFEQAISRMILSLAADFVFQAPV